MADMSTDRQSLSQSQNSLNSSIISGDNISKTNDEITSEIASEFCKFLNFNVEKEETKFNDSVEMMLTKLDEFFSLVDMIRSDTSLCLTTTLPQIQEKCAEMEFIFDKIDKLEVFVNMVKDCVAATEDKVTKAENELGAIGGLVKKLTSFVSLQKKSPLQAASKGKKPEFIPPEIFSTEDYLSPPAFNATQSTEEFGHSSQ
ncbi:biogenesis of lysosome-related organelles complex 1 subunit 4 [Biomphalaria pfeifferi]|uniref:Biogenesis of lysosome-related organelles complex 1 subunit 4 n=1 Tax=Biomphalaria pfeifferi TaxID=112525 RepID=A0AAD8BY25_BIOPF|nr:biogenesis of lysosome-related organelles complex 1 subunit 4 [Biomphalaria pfeifferi]